VPSATHGTAFVLMVLTMIVVRTIGVVLRGRAAGATISFSGLRVARRLARRRNPPRPGSVILGDTAG
jgi:hypothetical protein